MFIPEKIIKTKEAHKKAIENFSPTAKKADFELTLIYKSPDLSIYEKRQKVQVILKTLKEKSDMNFKKIERKCYLYECSKIKIFQ
jgi:hypothetical protein